MAASERSVAWAFALAIVVGAGSGCASPTWTVTSAEKDGRPDAVRAAGLPGDPDRITLQEGSQVSRNYWVVADLKVAVHRSPHASGVPTRAMVRDALRHKAAELGADAVILVRYGVLGPSPASAATLEGHGRAIKFR